MSSPQTATLAVEARGIEKSFGTAAVLRRVDLDVPRGQVAVIFGPNGAGKSTLLRVLATLARADEGSVRIGGHDVSRAGEGARLSLGAVLHSPMLYADMTAHENLAFFARMFRIGAPEERIAVLAERVGISDRLGQRVRELSHGYQKRVALARALLHSPGLLLLDEAETGLDETARGVFEGILADQRAGGGSALMTTHAVETGLALADRVLVMVEGRFVLDAPAAELSRPQIAELYRTHEGGTEGGV